MVRQGAAGRSCTFPTRTSPSSSGSGRSTDSARYHPYSINDSYIPSRPKHTTSATPTTLLSSGSPGSPVSKPIIKSKILAKDRMLALAPISGDQPVLRTTSGFNFDPHGCHWQAVKRILSTSLEASTRSNYGAGIDNFILFCHELGIPHRDRYPVSEGLLLAFVAHMGLRVRAGTIRNYISALATWHRSWNQPFHRGEAVNLALRAIEKAGPPKKPLRPPVTQDDLLAIFRILDVSNNSFHAAVWACALFSWWSMCRLGETTTANQVTCPTRNVMRSHLRGVATDNAGLSVATVWLPWTKTTLVSGMDKFILDAGGCLNTVFALRHHLRLSPVDPTLSSSTPLFAFRERAGSPLLALTKKEFLATVNSALAAAGREAHVGHSFRIVGATVHWRAGVPIDSIKLMGGWKSDTVMQYIRNLDLGLAGAHALTAAFLGGP